MANTPQLRKLGSEYGASGTLIQNGIISAEEYNRKLQGRMALQMYDIMLRSDADVHSMLEICKQPITAATWDVKPARTPEGDVTPEDQAVADFVKFELMHNNIDFDDLLYQALDMLDFGFSVFEKVYEVHDFQGSPRIGFSKIAFRKQTTIQYWQLRDGTPGITQQTVNQTLEIPMDKLIIFTNKKRGDNYEGISLLRYVFKDWDMKDKLTLVNAMALEQLAKGVPVISEVENSEVSQPDIDKAEKALQDFRANEKGYIKTPKGLKIEMMDMKSSSTKEVIPTLAMHKRAIYSSIQATFMDLGGSSGSGAQSLSKDLTAFFLKSEEYIAKTFRRALNTQAIKQLCDLNFTSLPNGYPEVTNGSIADDDIVAAATAMSGLTTAGLITPDAEMEDVIRQKFGMPAMPKELKDTYEERHAPPDINADPNAEDNLDKKDPNKTDKPKDKAKDTTKAAISASRDAQRRVIEVIFADED